MGKYGKRKVIYNKHNTRIAGIWHKCEKKT